MRIFCSLPGGHVLGRHVQDPVRIDVESHLNLGHAPRGRRKAVQVELAEKTVAGALGDRTFSLENADRDGRLIVLCRRKGLLLDGRNGRVPLDQLGKDAAERFDAERQWRHVEE